MNYIKCFLLAGVAVVAAAVSCAKVQDSSTKSYGSNVPIGFTASTHKTTKAAVHNLDSAKQYRYTLTAYNAEESTGQAVLYIEPEDFGYGINPEFPVGWNTVTTHFWPETTLGTRPKTSLSLFSWGPKICDMTFDLNGYSWVEERTFPKLSVTVNDEYGDQMDMLAAMSEYETYTTAGATISYNHILSAISFSAVAESDSLKYIVKDIRVGVARNDTSAGRLCPSGVYTYARNNAKGTWDAQSGEKKYYKIGMASADTVKKTEVNLTAGNGLLMLIPQDLEDSLAYFSIVFDVFNKDNTVCATNQIRYGCLFTTSLKAWQTGVKYKYIVTIPEILYMPLEYNVSVSDWTDQDVIVAESESVYSEEDPEKIAGDGGNFGRENW